MRSRLEKFIVKTVRRAERQYHERQQRDPITPGVFLAEVRAMTYPVSPEDETRERRLTFTSGELLVEALPKPLRDVFVSSLAPRGGSTYADRKDANKYQVDVVYRPQPEETQSPAEVVLTRIGPDGDPVSRIGVKFGKDKTTKRPQLTVGHAVVGKNGEERTVKEIIVGQYEGKSYIQEVHTPGIVESRHGSFAPHAPGIAGELIAFAKIQGRK